MFDNPLITTVLQKQNNIIVHFSPFFRKYLQATFRRNVKNCRIVFKHFGYYFRACYNFIDKAINVFRKKCGIISVTEYGLIRLPWTFSFMMFQLLSPR